MTTPLAPTLLHALGDPENRKQRVRFIGPTNLVVHKYVACEHPRELLEALKVYDFDSRWFEAHDGSIFRVGAMYGAEIA